MNINRPKQNYESIRKDILDFNEKYSRTINTKYGTRKTKSEGKDKLKQYRSIEEVNKRLFAKIIPESIKNRLIQEDIIKDCKENENLRTCIKPFSKELSKDITKHNAFNENYEEIKNVEETGNVKFFKKLSMGVTNDIKDYEKGKIKKNRNSHRSTKFLNTVNIDKV